MNKPIQSMTLAELFNGYVAEGEMVNVEVSTLSLDSRTCIKGCVYFALKGFATHGLNFINDVLAEDVLAVVVDAGDEMLTAEITEKISKACQLIIVDDLDDQLGNIAARYYATNRSGCQVVAVTGTDGKTSVVHFVAQALGFREKCVGILGTAGWGFPGELAVSALTTPDVLEVHRQIYELRKSGARFICMEVSSHALEQGRVDGIEFTAAVLTNLARDHLDFHGTLENYASAKRKLFLKPNLQAVILNSEDEFGRKLLADREVVARKISYGCSNESTYGLKSVDSAKGGLQITAERSETTFRFTTQLLGSFNAYNVLAAWAVLDVLNFPQADITEALSTLRPVIGRMERFSNDQGPTVVVDFAHTPQALGLALTEVKKHCNGSVWCVFGCGGDRDKGKRSKMGAAASTIADYVVVTNDNPRTENPEKIAEDILSGIKTSTTVEVMLDREKAIRYSLDKAASNDWVVVAGKGHEDYQVFGYRRINFSDRDVVQQVLEEAV